jgi:hypothetical protein
MVGHPGDGLVTHIERRRAMRVYLGVVATIISLLTVFVALAHFAV